MIGENEKPRLISKHWVIRAELPFGWLVDVWATNDLATIWGRSCLDAATLDGRIWTLTTSNASTNQPIWTMWTLPEASTRSVQG
jgi:hypothetical protein